jgi:hypothetical protein
LLVTKDAERFQKSLPQEHIHHTCDDDLNAFMALTVPSLQGSTIQCAYTLEVHIYYRGLTTKKLRAAIIPI